MTTIQPSCKGSYPVSTIHLAMARCLESFKRNRTPALLNVVGRKNKKKSRIWDHLWVSPAPAVRRQIRSQLFVYYYYRLLSCTRDVPYRDMAFNQKWRARQARVTVPWLLGTVR